MAESYSGQCIILIEQSEAMQQKVVLDQNSSQSSVSLPTKPLISLVSTSLNAALRKWSEDADFSLAIIGYRQTSDGTNELVNRQGNIVEQPTFESLASIVADPVEVEMRTKSVQPGKSETFEFPLYYVPQTDGAAPQNFAFQSCLLSLRERLADSKTGFGGTIIFHICTSPSSDGNPLKVIEEIQQLKSSDDQPLVFQIHMSGSNAANSYRYPANRLSLPSKAKELHARASILPDVVTQTLKNKNITTANLARGLVYNAKLVDLAQSLQLIPCLVHTWPIASDQPDVLQENVTEAEDDHESAEPVDRSSFESDETTTESENETNSSIDSDDSSSVVEELEAEKDESLSASDNDSSSENEVELDVEVPNEIAAEPSTHRVICLLGRGVSDPYSSEIGKLFSKLQTFCNSVIHQISETDSQDYISVGLVVYGSNTEGQPDIQIGFEGDSEERNWVSSNDLSDVSIRIIETEEEVPNGIGGLLKIPRKTPVYIEVEPASYGATTEGASKVKELVVEAQNGTTVTLLHFLLAPSPENETNELKDLVDLDRENNFRLFHVVVTETPHPACSFPLTSDEQIQDEKLKAIFEASSPYQSSESKMSRGLCVNSITNLIDAVLN